VTSLLNTINPPQAIQKINPFQRYQSAPVLPTKTLQCCGIGKVMKYGNKDNKVPTPNLAYAYTQLQMLYPPFKVKVNMLLAFIYIILVL